MPALTPQIKAAAISAAIYTATGIEPMIINRPGQPPLITFSRENSPKINAFIQNSLSKKSDVMIDFFPYIGPIVLKQLFTPILLGVLGAAALGYLAGKANPF